MRVLLEVQLTYATETGVRGGRQMTRFPGVFVFGFRAGLRALAVTLLLTMPFQSQAGLGDVESSVQSDQARMNGVLRSVDRHAYLLHEITSPTGTVTREFVSPGGKVFGVAWEGTGRPDLRQLLGPYYRQALMAQAQQPRPRGAPVVIETPGLVIYEAGHMRSFHGHAYIPELMPQGVQASDIR
jgi:hypothetical protein